MPSDPLNLEPKNGDFVDYIESLQASSQKNLDGITPPMTADHHIGLPPNAAGRADDGISLKDLIAAFRRKTGMPKASPQDSSREASKSAFFCFDRRIGRQNAVRRPCGYLRPARLMRRFPKALCPPFCAVELNLTARMTPTKNTKAANISTAG